MGRREAVGVDDKSAALEPGVRGAEGKGLRLHRAHVELAPHVAVSVQVEGSVQSNVNVAIIRCGLRLG